MPSAPPGSRWELSRGSQGHKVHKAAVRRFTHKKAPHERGLGGGARKARPRAGGQEIQARPPSQHDKRHGCSRRTFAQKKPGI
jgi:hypothetical protein